jgi:hypothetical protein
VRGSPLIRTFLILAALVVSGIGFARLTQRGTVEPETKNPVEMPESADLPITAKFSLILSASPSSVELDGNAGTFQLEGDLAAELLGKLKIDPKARLVSLKVNWDEDSTSRRFAKLVIEAPGKKTFTHFFDADGDIDDFVELPF